MNDLTAYEGTRGDIQVYREPEVVLAEATKAAQALTTVLASKKKKVMMNGEQYLEFEDWQTVGRFYGITAKVTSTEFIDYGSAQGFLAKASVVRSDGIEISAAEAMCLNDEEKWSARTKYEYVYVLKDGTKQAEKPESNQIVWVDNPNKPGKKMPKTERVAAGEVRVPLFQLRSMAQTRACAKALRNVLSWVVVLAGYKPTPAEELDGKTEIIDAEYEQGDPGPGSEDGKAPLKEPQKKAPSGNGSSNKISDAQSKRFYAIARGSGKTDEDISAYLAGLGFNHTADITKDKYDEACGWAAGKPAEREPGQEG